MPKATFTQTNFTAGEISPKAMGRFDLSKFTNAVKIMENFLNYQLGGGIFRPGTKFAVACKSSSDSARIIPFQYSTTQNYIIELGNLYMRFCSSGAQVVSGSTVVEIASPYTSAQLYDMMYTQSADTMYLVHGSHHPRKLVRNSATTFTMSLVPFVRGPFMDTNVTATTITPSSATSNTNLLASASIFNASHVGSYWRVNAGVVKIVSYVSPSGVTGAVQAEPDGTAGNLGGTAAYTDWAEGEFSDYRGYPEAVTFHEGRLYYANTRSAPQKFWGSVIGAYDDFSEGTAADDEAPTFEILTEQVNEIQWLSPSAKGMDIGTSGGTFPASGSAGLPITPSDIVVPRATTFGVAKVRPVRFSGYLYYLQRNLMNIRELFFSFDLDQQKTNDMNLLADHILRDGSGVKDMAYQQSPAERIWAVRNDGEIAILTRNVDQEVMGWTRIVAGNDARGAGKFESIAILPEVSTDDTIYVIVKRNINGVTKRFIEYFSSEYFAEDWDAIRLDSSLSLNNSANITGATQANPVVITALAHGFSDGDEVKIIEVEGMTELNNNTYIVADKTTDTFALKSIYGGLDSFTSLLINFDGVDGSKADYTAETGQTVSMGTTLSNDAQLDTAQKKFGTASLLVDGTGDFATVPDSDLFDFDADFTIEFFIRFNSLPTVNGAQLLGNTDAAFSTTGWSCYRQPGASWTFYLDNGTRYSASASTTIVINTWYHFAVVRSGSTVTIYQDGVSVGSATISASVTSTGVLGIGGYTGYPAFCLDGWIDGLRISKGIARWTTDFTPPTSAYADHAYIDGTAFTEYYQNGKAFKTSTIISGLSHLEGETVSVVADGGVPSGQQTFTVLGGSFSLLQKAAVVHAGLPYNGTIQMLKLSDGSPVGTGQTKKRRIYLSTVRVDRSLGMKIGRSEDALSKVYFRAPNDTLGKVVPYFTGDVEKFFDTGWGSEDEIIIRQDQPLPLCILAVVLRSEVEER